jgi:hypothetical protein
MRKGSAFTVILLGLASWPGRAAAQGPQAPKPAADAPKAYASPQAVFDAFRGARAKGDKRTEFYCLTPEGRDGEVLGAYLVCKLTKDTPKMAAVRKQFGVEESVVDAEVEKRFRGVQQPPWEAVMDVCRRVVNEKVTDKVGFVVAMDEARGRPDYDRARIGPLKGVRVQDDTAIGQAAVSTYHLSRKPGMQKDEKVWTTEDEPFRFRRTKDGWLIDPLGL